MKPSLALPNYLRYWLVLLLLFISVFAVQAQDPADFFDHEAERQFQDSLHEQNPDLSREEMRQAMQDYYRQRADAYYRAYRKRIDRQKVASRSLPGQGKSQGLTLNSASSQGQVPDSVEYAALEALYNATNGNHWRYNDNWLQGATNADFATWYGVEVEDGDVTALRFWYNRLAGALPSSIERLSGLQHLDFASNDLSSLPAELASLSNLRTLSVSSNQLGALSFDVGKLTQLRTLHISYNQLSSVPRGIDKLTELQYLSLSGNNMTIIPPEIGSLLNLQYLGINNNPLVGLPIEISNLAQLNYLGLRGCDLIALPAVVGSLANLHELALGSNKLATLPPEIRGLVNLSSYAELT